MRKTLFLAALALPLAACATSPYGYGASNPLGAILGSIGSLGSPYSYGSSYGASSGFSQAAVNACGSAASRYGQVRIRQVQQISGSSMKVWGDVYGYRNDSWDCTFRSDGRITNFDI